MKIKCLDTRHLAGHHLIEKGQEYDLPDHVAAQLIEQGLAELKAEIEAASPKQAKGVSRPVKED